MIKLSYSPEILKKLRDKYSITDYIQEEKYCRASDNILKPYYHLPRFMRGFLYELLLMWDFMLESQQKALLSILNKTDLDSEFEGLEDKENFISIAQFLKKHCNEEWIENNIG